MPKKTRHKNKRMKGGNGQNRTVKGNMTTPVGKNAPAVTSMTKNNVVNLTPVEEPVEPPFIGKPWSGDSMSLLPDGTFVDQPPNYFKYNQRFTDPQQFLLSSTNAGADAPPLVTAPHGFLHTHRHFHPHTGGKKARKIRRKTRRKKNKKRKKMRRKTKGGRKDRLFQGVTNMFRKTEDGFVNLKNNIEGVEPRISSDPTTQPIEQFVPTPPYKGANIEGLLKAAQKKVVAL